MSNRLEIRNINNLRISLLFGVWYLPTCILTIPIYIIRKELLFMSFDLFYRILFDLYPGIWTHRKPKVS